MKCLVIILLVAVGHAKVLERSLGKNKINDSQGVDNKTSKEVGHVKALLVQAESEGSTKGVKRTAGGKRMAPDKGSKVDPRIRDVAKKKRSKCKKNEQGCDEGISIAPSVASVQGDASFSPMAAQSSQLLPPVFVPGDSSKGTFSLPTLRASFTVEGNRGTQSPLSSPTSAPFVHSPNGFPKGDTKGTPTSAPSASSPKGFTLGDAKVTKAPMAVPTSAPVANSPVGFTVGNETGASDPPSAPTSSNVTSPIDVPTDDDFGKAPFVAPVTPPGSEDSDLTKSRLDPDQAPKMVTPDAVLNTHGASLTDPRNDSHVDTTETLTNTTVINLESDKLLLEYGGVGLITSVVEASMYNIMNDQLTTHFRTQIGSILNSFALDLNFLPDAPLSARGGGSQPPRNTESTGVVEVQTAVRLVTNNTIMITGMDETFVTLVLMTYFEGDSLDNILDALNRTGMMFSFLRLKSNSSILVEGNLSYTTKDLAPVTSTLTMAAALSGVIVLVLGVGALARRRRSTRDDTDLQEFEVDESEEDHFHPLAPAHYPSQSTPSFRATNPFEDSCSDDDDSLGSERYLDWPVEKEVSSRRRQPSLHDISVDDDEGEFFGINL